MTRHVSLAGLFQMGAPESSGQGVTAILGQDANDSYWGNYLISKSGFNVALTMMACEELELLMQERLEVERQGRLH